MDYRALKCAFWEDEWVRTLAHDEMLFAIFTCINPWSTWSGIYRIPEDIPPMYLRITAERAAEIRARLEDHDFARFAGRVVYVPAYLEHQPNANANTWVAIMRQVLDAVRWAPREFVADWLERNRGRARVSKPEAAAALAELSAIVGEWFPNGSGTVPKPSRTQQDENCTERKQDKPARADFSPTVNEGRTIGFSAPRASAAGGADGERDVLGIPLPSSTAAWLRGLPGESQREILGKLTHSGHKFGTEVVSRVLGELDGQLRNGYRVEHPEAFVLGVLLPKHEKIIRTERRA